MSASREKKQRQNAGPDPKTLKVQQEQAARKRKTIAYTAVGVVSAALIAALFIWTSGFFQGRTTAATLGDEKVTAAELSYYYANVRGNYANYGLIDTSKSDAEQLQDAEKGVTYRDFFLDEALHSAQRQLALAKEAVKEGHTEAEIQNGLDAAIDDIKSTAAAYGYRYDAYLKAIFGEYMSPSVYKKLTARYLMAQLVADEKYDELYEGYTQDDLTAYYNEDDHADTLDTIEYSYLYFPVASVDTKDEDGNELDEDELNKRKDEAKAEAKEKAEEALAAVKDGASFDSQKEKYELTTGADHITSVGIGSISSSYSEELLKLGKDQCKLVELDSGACYVIAFHDRYLAEEPTRDVRHILIRAENTTGEDNKLVAPTDEAWAAAKEKMDAIQAEWDASGKTEDDFAKLANEKSEDSGSNTNGGLYQRRYDGYFVSEFNDWVFDSSRKAGEVGLVQHVGEEGATSGYWGYHLIYFVGENEPVWMGSIRDTMAGEAQNTWVDGLTANFPAALLGGTDYVGK